MIQALLISSVLLSAVPAALAAPAFDAKREAALRSSAEFVMTLSDEDYRDLASSAAAKEPAPAWSKLDRPALLQGAFLRLAAGRDAATPAPVEAGRETVADARAAGVDGELLQEAGWWGDLNRWAESNRYQYRGPAAVAAVRGGRKLSTDADKRITKLLAEIDRGDAALGDSSLSPAEAATLHMVAADHYREIAGLFKPAAAAAATAPAAALSAKQIYQKAAPSVVLILGSDGGGQGELGTGSVVDGGRVLTNAHVVVNDKTGRPFETVRVYLKPSTVTGDAKRDLQDPVAARVARFDRALDLAVLEFERPLKAAPLALGDDAAVEPGDPVVAIGHPEQGGLWTLTQGVVSTVVADLGGVAGKDAFQTDASINRGNSGGPLLDRGGAIVGVNTAMARKAADGLTITSVNFSVKSSVARRWLGQPASAPAAAAPTAPAAPAAPVAAVPAQAAPAPAAELPPPPATKPVMVTPAKPYRIEDVVAEGTKEMEDLESEMRREIQSRRGR